MRLAHPSGVAVVFRSARAKAGLVAGDAARIAELVCPVTGTDEELIALRHVLIDTSVEVVIGALLLSMGQVIANDAGAGRHWVDVQISLADRIEHVRRNDVARKRLTGCGVVNYHWG